MFLETENSAFNAEPEKPNDVSVASETQNEAKLSSPSDLTNEQSTTEAGKHEESEVQTRKKRTFESARRNCIIL